ncbi:MAG: hypothetical protein WAT33_06825 [Giesbergeria sp.]
MALLTLSENPLYELSDAANEVIQRMLVDGLNDAEIRLRALPNLWEAYRALHLAIVGTLDTPAIHELEPRVLNAIANPKRKA